MEEVRWGVLGTAKIALEHVILALMKCKRSRLVAIASRDLARAQETADRFGIPNAHGSYEALLADPEVDAIYNPLPNHLHVPWSEKAAERGKHVLCEKTLALTATAVRSGDSAQPHVVAPTIRHLDGWVRPSPRRIFRSRGRCSLG